MRDLLLVRSAPRRATARALLPLALAGLLLVAPGCGGEGDDGASGGQDADGTSAAADTGMPAGMPGSPQGSGAIREYRQLNQQIQQIRQEALQDSAVGAEQADLRESVMAAMRENQQTATQMDRFDSLRQQMQQAQQEGDSARMRELIPRLQRLQMSLQRAQQQVLQRGEISGQLDTFQSHLEDEMKEVDPRTSELLSRQDSLVEEIRSQAPTGRMPSRGGSDTASDTARGG